MIINRGFYQLTAQNQGGKLTADYKSLIEPSIIQKYPEYPCQSIPKET